MRSSKYTGIFSETNYCITFLLPTEIVRVFEYLISLINIIKEKYVILSTCCLCLEFKT